MVDAENGGWVGHMGEVAPFFNFLLLIPSMRPQLTLRSVDFRSVHPKTCFGGGCVPLGSICPGGQIVPFFAPKKPFLNGPNKAIILHGSE